MVRKILALYLVAFLVCPTLAWAEDTEEEPTIEEHQIVPIEAGTPAPFDGVLLSLDAAAKIAVDKKFEDAECDLRVGYELHIQAERDSRTMRYLL